MNVVITGGSGHIGACLIPRMLAKGWRVRALRHGPSPILDGPGVEARDGDVRDLDSLRAAFEGQEVLIHMAALISVRSRDEAAMRAINVEGTANVARAALERGVRRMVHVSSVHAYESWRLGRPLREDDPPAVARELPAYDRTKAAGEREIRAAIERGLDATILNPAGILGPYDHRPSLAGQELMRLFRGGIQAVPSGGFSWVDVRDVADAILAAVERGATGENHLLAGDYADMATIFRLAAEARGRPTRPILLPVGMLLRIAPVAEALGSAAGLAHGFTPAAVRALASDLRVDSSRAKRVLGFRARPLAETIRDAIEWWRTNGRLKE